MTTIRIEAESLNLGNAFIEDPDTYAFASGEKLIRLTNDALTNGITGSATTNFSGDSGTYKVTVAYNDENDGTATIQLDIGGSNQSFLLDEDTDSSRASANNYRTRTVFDSLALTGGEAITLSGIPISGEGEAVRIDYIEFELIELTPSNNPPVAGDDNYTATVNTPLVVPIGTGLLANDTDIDLDSLTAVIATDPTNGSVNINADGSFTYTPATDSFVTDTFTYTVSDGTDTDEGAVTITIAEAPIDETSVEDVIFTFEQFVQFEAIDEQRPYQGNVAELSTEIGGITIASLFDETHYLAQNSDVADAIDRGDFAYGFQHFLQFGYLEGRDPSVLFDEEFYLSTYQDVQNAVDMGQFSSGLQHFLLTGHVENRDPSDLFDADDYLTNNPDVDAAVQNQQFRSGFEHYVEFGADEGRLPNLLLFNEAYYLANNQDVAEAVDMGGFASGFEHYVTFGQGEDRDPSSLFDESAYLEANPDVAGAVPGGLSSGFEHYFRFGRAEGRPLETQVV
jgi:hypothetical protein